MLDVHPPHHPTHTWRDFLLHIATIVVGLLIAVGLEQTVEYIHHRRQVVELREALQTEVGHDTQLFALQTQEFHRFAPRLLTDAAILQALRDHPHLPADQWPGKFDFTGFYIAYDLVAWNNAQTSGVLAYMPGDEVNRFNRFYTYIEQLDELQHSYREAIFQLRASFVSQPDAARFTPAEVETANDRMSQLLIREAISAISQRNMYITFSIVYHGFPAAPSQDEIDHLIQERKTAQQEADMQAIIRAQARIRAGQDPTEPH
jgi:hypothetical protein